jgi:hypothetical protein
MAARIVKIAMEKTDESSAFRPRGNREIQNIARGIAMRQRSEEMLKTIWTIEYVWYVAHCWFWTGTAQYWLNGRQTMA